MSSSKSQSQKPSLNYGSPCAACKFLRRKCLPDCIFAPHFPADQPQKFAILHRNYGASNISKFLNQLSYDDRDKAVNSLVYEAQARLNEPVYGCVRFISTLEKRLKELRAELFAARMELSTYTMLSKTQGADHVPILPPLHMPVVGSSSSSSLMTRTSREGARGGQYLFEQMLTQCPEQMTIDAINNVVGFDSSYGFNANDSIQPHVDQMSNLRLHQLQIQQQSFGSQQTTTAEQQPPTTMHNNISKRER